MNKSNSGRKGLISACTIREGGTGTEAEAIEKQLTGLLSMACSVAFLNNPGPPAQGEVALPTVG